MRQRDKSRRFGRAQAVVALMVLGLVAAACGSSSNTSSATTTTQAAVTTTAATGTTGATATTSAGTSSAKPLRIALVAPSAADDLAFTQSMVDALHALKEPIDLSITDGTFVVEEAATAIREYAKAGNDIVIAHGTQYGASLAEIAPDFPNTTFLWGTSTDTMGLPNVFAYAPAAAEGGYVNGITGAAISKSGILGVVGPIEAGDAVTYINGFKKGALAGGASDVPITYTGSFGDVALAAEAAKALIANGADVLTGSAQMVVGAIGVAADDKVPWFGTQANQASLAPTDVVASQVYHWEVILEQIIAKRAAGTLGGEAFEINLANGGLVIEFNDGYPLPADARAKADAAIAGIKDGSIDPNG